MGALFEMLAEDVDKYVSKKRDIEIARNLLKRNRPLNEIVEDTDLTREEVESLSI